MVKFISISILSALYAIGFGQGGAVTLGKAIPVDINVVEAEWQPAGRVLLYKREEEKGFSLGIYGVGHREGKVIVPIQKGDTWDTNWLADSNSALLVVQSPMGEGKTKSFLIRIFLVDGDFQSAQPLFSQTYAEKLLPSINVDCSPSLKHAIVTLRNSEGSSHKVLCLGGGSFTNAPDLDRAEKEGLSGPNWSVDGTAIYSNLPQPKFRVLSDTSVVKSSDKVGTVSITDDTKQTTEEIRFVIATSADKDSGTSSGNISEGSLTLNFVGGTFKIGPPLPKTGTSVLELMTANPILRPVRFRGPWVNLAAVTSKVVNRNQSIVLYYDQSNAQDNSVWLTAGPEKGSPATLVAVHVSETWLSEQKNSIAYLIDGALFFRSIGK